MLNIKIGRKENQEKDRVVESAVINFVELKAEIDKLNLQLAEQKELLINKAKELIGKEDVSTITLGVDDDNVKISFGFDVKVEDEAKLTELLGDRFDDLVQTTISYKPRTKLKEMALEDDGLKECLSIKEKAPSIAVVK